MFAYLSLTSFLSVQTDLIQRNDISFLTHTVAHLAN